MLRRLCITALIHCCLLNACAPAAIIEPGDAIFTNSDNEWFRYRLSTDELIGLDWEPPSIFVTDTTFDDDGHLLLAGSFFTKKINPATGLTTAFTLLGISESSLAIAPNGDYLKGNETGFVSRFDRNGENRIWNSQQLSISSHSRIQDLTVSGNFSYGTTSDGIWEIDLATGNSELVVETSELSNERGPQWIKTRSDGDILFTERQASPFVYRYNPSNRLLSSFLAPPTFASNIYNIAFDSSDRFWFVSDGRLFMSDAEGANVTRISAVDLDRITRLSIVPADWSPPVPEPGSAAVLAIGLLLSSCRRTYKFI